MVDFWTVLIGLIIVVIVVEAITEIVVNSALLDIVGLRPMISKKAIPIDNDYTKVRWYHTAFHKLLTCGYCTSVWVAFLGSWFMPGDYFGLMPWDNIVIKVFLIHRLANYWHVLYELYRRGRVRTIDVSLTLKLSDDSSQLPLSSELDQENLE